MNNCKKGPLKRLDIFREIVVAFSISMFMLILKPFDLYQRVFKSFSLE